MEDYKCLDISFPGVDFDSYETGAAKVSSTHHAHLFTRENEIEIRVYFDARTNFARKFSAWVGTINWSKFGTYTMTSNETQTPRLLKIDLSIASLLKVSESEYLSIEIDKVKLHWPSEPERLNTADLFLNDEGFNIVQPFYSVLWHLRDEGQFKIARMDGRHQFYSLRNALFRPEFDFQTQDAKSSNEAHITKEPKVHFKNLEGLSQEEITRYGDIVKLMAAFYSRSEVDYKVTKLYLNEATIVTKQIQKGRHSTPLGGLYEFGLNWHFDEFMKAVLSESAIENHTKLAAVIPLFHQSILVGGSSRFLMRFNIVEICKSGTSVDDSKFEFIKGEEEVKGLFDRAFELLLQMVSSADHGAFKDKWNGIIYKMRIKPIASPLEEFLKKENLPIEKFPIKVKRLKEIRDALTHGSLESINADEIEKSNKLMFSISGALILNLLGIRNWKVYTDIS